MTPYQELMELLQRVALGELPPESEHVRFGSTYVQARQMTLEQFIQLRNVLFEAEVRRLENPPPMQVLTREEFQRMMGAAWNPPNDSTSDPDGSTTEV